MSNNARFAEVASLAGDPARVGMLHALMDGRALTASELARVANVTPQTASEHLAKMAAAAPTKMSTASSTMRERDGGRERENAGENQTGK